MDFIIQALVRNNRPKGLCVRPSCSIWHQSQLRLGFVSSTSKAGLALASWVRLDKVFLWAFLLFFWNINWYCLFVRVVLLGRLHDAERGVSWPSAFTQAGRRLKRRLKKAARVFHWENMDPGKTETSSRNSVSGNFAQLEGGQHTKWEEHLAPHLQMRSHSCSINSEWMTQTTNWTEN